MKEFPEKISCFRKQTTSGFNRASQLICVMVLLCFPGVLHTQFIPELDFKNITIGIGMNHSRYDFSYPEVLDFSNTDLKNSFLIDIRMNYTTYYDLIFSPTFELWSWTDNSGAQYDVIQNGLNDYMFSFDFSRVFGTYGKFQSYIGGGIGFHFLTYWTRFPRFNPVYHAGTTSQLRNITVYKTFITPNLLGGIEYHLWDEFCVSMEIRREFNNSLKQWKFLLNISMFD